MHNAPSVTYPVGRSRFAGWLLLTAWTAGVVALTGWTAQVRPSAAPLALAWSVVLLAGAVAARAWVSTTAGVLTWEGQTWRWTVGERVLQAHPEVVLDLQRVLLLRLGTPGGAAWLWLEKRKAPTRWDDLRRAVYSRAKPEGLPGAQSPGATR